jgi:carbonic anhydrase
MKALLDGVRLFHEKHFTPERGLFEKLAIRQEPQALFITCSDSRIDPNLLTQTRPGEIFVLRNAGNIVPPHGTLSGGESATIEYAITALNIKDIIVCGHSDCGAMKALIDRESLHGLTEVQSWLEHGPKTRFASATETSGVIPAGMLDSLIEKNVLTQLENLRTHPAVASRLREGGIRLHGWVYHIDKGTVHVFDKRNLQFVPALDDHTVSAYT